jgi:hypothetical protein
MKILSRFWVWRFCWFIFYRDIKTLSLWIYPPLSNYDFSLHVLVVIFKSSNRSQHHQIGVWMYTMPLSWYRCFYQFQGGWKYPRCVARNFLGQKYLPPWENLCLKFLPHTSSFSELCNSRYRAANWPGISQEKSRERISGCSCHLEKHSPPPPTPETSQLLVLERNI